MTTLHTLQSLKANDEKFACITAYDAIFANLASQAGIEVILVGDSLGNVIQGLPTTVPVTVDDICYHLRCVSNGKPKCLVMADLPFMSYATPDLALANATRLMQAGAQVVKLEGGTWLAETVKMLSERGIPVCAHLGLTPQSVHALGGFRVQGRTEASALRLAEDAVCLQKAGASLLVLECIPSSLAADVAGQLAIPTIGIGAGAATDGQILVLHDLLGLTMNNESLPKFAKDFLAAAGGGVLDALRSYRNAVKRGEFPGKEHCF